MASTSEQYERTAANRHAIILYITKQAARQRLIDMGLQASGRHSTFYLNFGGSVITTTISPFTTTVLSSTTTTAGGSCPPPGYPDYSVDCGNDMCCPYFYPICCDDGYCYTYQEYCPSSGITTTTVSFGCPVDYPIDCYNGWCCPADYPYCGTGFRTSKCFPGPPGPCAAEAALGNDEPKLSILRTFRDEVLGKTPEGQSLIRLYYEWSPALAQAIDQDEEFKQEIKGLIESIVPAIAK